jgi:hypothetical protein
MENSLTETRPTNHSILPNNIESIPTDFDIDFPALPSNWKSSNWTVAVSGSGVTHPSMAVRDETMVVVEISLQAVILFLALVGNGVVLAMLMSMSRIKDLSRMYTMIGHLSCADLFVAIFNLLPQVGGLKKLNLFMKTFEDAMCRPRCALSPDDANDRGLWKRIHGAKQPTQVNILMVLSFLRLLY